MSNPHKIHIADYHYDLPDDKIAKYPLVDRSGSKLLVFKKNIIHEGKFRNLGEWIPKDSLLIFNNTKVIQARIVFHKTTGARIEIFCLEPICPKDYNQVFEETKECTWKCMVGNAKKWKNENLSVTLTINNQDIVLYASKMEGEADTMQVKFSWDAPITFAEILENVGELPIPPYLHRNTEDSDKETYQTVYSKIKGSVAAPTAGLHFSNEIFEKLRDNGIRFSELTLHVGAGTFKPVKSEEIGDHNMHCELISVDLGLLSEILFQLETNQKIIAVGTTSVRTIESLYYLARKIQKNPGLPQNQLTVEQWEPYASEEGTVISPQEAIQIIIDYLNKNSKTQITASTQIIIAPGFVFKYINGIITNFHQPQSTLLLLVSAFVGEKEWKNIYTFALEHNFRFLSYGDSSLLLK